LLPKAEGLYQICTRCVMDTSVAEIRFDSDGICHFCSEFLERASGVLQKTDAKRSGDLENFVEVVKTAGKGKQYDCIIGVSGGVDSSWSLVQAVGMGLRPLAVHMDNGWNSELAQSNIANLVRTLGVDLHTHVIEWNEYRKLMQAFFDADVIDVELLYDNAMLAVNYREAARRRVKFILAGTNQSTEGMSMPRGWSWFKYDKRNIRALAAQPSGTRIVTFPSIGTFDLIWYEFGRRIRWIPFLDFLDYRKDEALEVLQRDFAYKPYPYKHYESVFTRFYQGYLLPQKFGVDKRRLHLSILVATGQMEREEALSRLQEPPYPSSRELEQDKQYFLKKMGWTADQLESYVARGERPHTDYPSEKPRWDYLESVYRRFARGRRRALK